MTTATVVGSGPNGLAAAIRLAQAGVRVTVVEAEPTIGGGARTAELTLPGVRHDVGATAMPGLMSSPFFRSLGLERHGLRLRRHEAALAHPLDDGTTALLWEDLSRTAQGLGADGAAWARAFGPLVRGYDSVVEDTFAPLVHWPRHPIALAQTGLRAAVPATLFNRRFAAEPARALFAGAAAHGFTRHDTPLSAAIGVMLITAAHASGWPIVEGGSSGLIAALEAELRALGGRIETGRRVTDAAALGTDLVLLSVPPRTALRLLGDDVPAATRRAWARFRPGPAAFKVDYAIEGDIPWAAPDARRAGIVHLGGSAGEIAAVERAAVSGRMPERPFVLVAQQYLADPTRSAGGANPVWAYAHVPAGFDGDASAAVLAQIERFAPGVREQIVATHVSGPQELAAHNGAFLGGDIGGGANTALQLIARPRLGYAAYRGRRGRTYLCGSSTPPGGGVHGMAGFHAAETALRDIGAL
ncbi:MAG TPA: NAD(P)/FAD-dependent oxidoreductase [Microbacteriaceae bacterium]|jgi:phytoene dehydrogenase-like protein|nr:NAD(P)/FAD-dependent oxidoreductase [Microbacteriaceae bacterium]HQX35278.1 NAD(P)/FAD-dependent oxidoreductase [Microbacteriaceae bacterium]HQZ48096.1 NAD(P)/FAD-dependent oxidoreductase [Microbacteriaceae bacterium]HRA09188.1 NAD(P)/FAD-dependent oxidoreductase [Microbacteriaceae bacterium]